MRYFGQITNKLRTILAETTLNDHQAQVADNWNHHKNLSDDTHEKIGNAMTHGTHTVFKLPEEVDTDPDVEEHLGNHGWEIHDYKEGLAKKKTMVGNPEKGIPMREKHITKKIGAVLKETGASEDVQNAFANDPNRQTKNTSNLHVVISTHPHAIAGMSTGTDWKNSSCMDMVAGINAHYLRLDSENGTHVAFLVHGDDETAMKHGLPSKPVARIALKPYHEDSHEGTQQDRDTVFRPEERTYGAGNASFERSVAKWASENYPAKKDTTYFKNDDVYDDTGNNEFTNYSKETAHNMMHGDGLEHTSYDREVVDHLVSNSTHPETGHIRHAQDVLNKVQNLSAAHINKLFNYGYQHHTDSGEILNRNEFVAIAAGKHGNRLSKTNLNRTLDSLKHEFEHGPEFQRGRHGKFSVPSDEPYSTEFNSHWAHAVPTRMLMHPNLPNEVVDAINPREYSHVNPKLLKDHHLDKVLDLAEKGVSGSSYLLHDHLSNFKEHHLIRAARLNRIGASDQLNNSPHFTQAVHDAMVEHAEDNAGNLANSKFAKYSDIHKLKSDAGKRTFIHGLLGREDLGDEEHKKLADHIANSTNRGRTIRIPEHIAKHMNDNHFDKMIEMAKTGSPFTLEPLHFETGNRILDRLEKHIYHHDDKIANLEDGPEKDEHYEQLHKLINIHAGTIDNMIDRHVEMENNGYNPDHLQSLQDRIHKNDFIGLDSVEEALDRHNNYVDPHEDITQRLERIENDRFQWGDHD